MRMLLIRTSEDCWTKSVDYLVCEDIENLEAGIDVAIPDHTFTIRCCTASYGVDRFVDLPKHWLQHLMTGATELRSIVLVHELNVFTTLLEISAHCLDQAWKPSSRRKGGVAICNGDLSRIIVKSSSTQDPLAGIVHHVLHLAVLCETKFPHAPLEVHGKNPVQELEKLLDVQREVLKNPRLCGRKE